MDSQLDNLVIQMTNPKKSWGTIDQLLLANTFLEDEDIWHTLDDADRDSWNYICANINKYPHRVQTIFNPSYFMPDKSKFKMKVVELTDETEAAMRVKLKAAKAKEFDAVWAAISENIERPVDILDEELDDAWNALSAARDRMTIYLEKKKSRYVPPSARRTVDEEQKEIEDDIAECKAAFDEIENRIAAADKVYLAKKKDERFEEWLLQMSP